MPAYDVFFFSAVFFLIGIFLAGLGMKTAAIYLIGILAVLCFFSGVFYKKNYFVWLAFLSFFAVLGLFYFQLDDLSFNKTDIVFDKKIIFRGQIINDPEISFNKQEFKLKLPDPLKDNILIRTSPYPAFNYGDIIELRGIIKKPPPDSWGNYLAKEKIKGVSNFPSIELITAQDGSVFKEKLFSLKHSVISSFQNVLPPPEAAFLSGLTLGSRGEFSKEFKEAMNKSGTTHLVALSGYNITIIAKTAAVLLLLFLSRRLSFVITLFLIFSFVLMTGAEASVVRAAIMGFLALLAGEMGRAYDIRNSIALAALIMAIFNPKILVFDVGFQLSFLALLGIIYLKPVIIKLFKLSSEPGFLAWRENFLITLSAQLAVVPILISNFGYFSFVSLAANVIILETVPLVMALGFIIAGFYFISFHLAMVLGWLAWLILKFEILIIELFAKIPLFFSASLNVFWIIIYYLFLLFLIFYAARNVKFNQKI